MAGQWHLDAATYLAMVQAEVPAYAELQDTVAEATTGVRAHRILDLGSGTGETARRVAARHPDAEVVGVDASADMLRHAQAILPEARFVEARLEDPLPPGPYDLVVSAFAVHHLDGTAKADLFARVADVLRRGGRFVLCDVVVPVGPVAAPVPLEPGVDRPDASIDQVRWMTDAGLTVSVILERDDLAVLVGDRL